MQLDLIFNKWRIFFLKNSGMNWKQKRYGIAVFILWSSFNVKLIEISIFSFFFLLQKALLNGKDEKIVYSLCYAAKI